MSSRTEETYPNSSYITRTIELGGRTKEQLVQSLREKSIQLNEYGEKLLQDEKFTTTETKYSLETVELTVASLGYPEGATTNQIFTKAMELNFQLCPLELAPYLRLEYLDQPEANVGIAEKRQQAPTGSVTIATEKLTNDVNFPNGFYLRRMNGELWLRGYVADDEHIWNPEDHFIFCLPKSK